MPISPLPVEVVAKETPFQGYFRVDRYTFRHGLFSGEMGPEISREVFERGHAACIVPYDPIRDEVVLIEQFRPGAYAAGMSNPWLTEIVAGIIEPSETPENVVIREASEEAHLTITALHDLGRFLMTPGASSESMTMFVGRCDASEAGGIHGLPEEGEDIRVFKVPALDAIAMGRRGEIINAKSTLALLLFDGIRQDLRREWS